MRLYPALPVSAVTQRPQGIRTPYLPEKSTFHLPFLFIISSANYTYGDDDVPLCEYIV